MRRSELGSPIQRLPRTDPNAEHIPGIYSYQNGYMSMLKNSPATTNASGGLKAAASMGIAKVNSKIIVNGSHSATQILGSPVFYFFFEKQQSGFGTSGAPNSTDQFKLLRFDIKKNSREAVVMQENGLGSTSGIPDKNSIPFSSEKLANGGSKVTAGVSPGEYCLINVGALTVFDFAVVEKK